MYPYRVFMSCRREDRAAADGVTAYLRELGLRPFSSADIMVGESYSQGVREHILSAHVFMPLMTAGSMHRPWIHQETGFAMGSAVAVLPILLKNEPIPAELASQFHGVQIAGDMSDIHEYLTVERFEKLAAASGDPEFANYQTAADPDRRFELLIRRAEKVHRWGYRGRVRESYLLSSFSFPDAPVDSVEWDRCEGKVKKPIRLRRLYRELRRSLEQHAREEGCDLLLYPQGALDISDIESWRHRLDVLRDFVKSMPKDKVRLAFRPRPAYSHQLIVGDWFAARCIGGAPGVYPETMITKHSFVVLDRISRFEAELEQYAPGSDAQPFDREASLAVLDGIETQAVAAHRTEVPKWQVFISFKSEDAMYAEKIYDALTAHDIDAFFSKKSLPRVGESDYGSAIDEVLDEVKHLVVVASQKENVLSGWVKYEWGFFVNELKSGRKPDGNIVIVTAGDMKPKDLPPSLRHQEAVPYGPGFEATVMSYLR